ncbi:MAG: hypothetical protein L6R40_006360 [Gallowayella cf. fulva]|nr:MAG: hypothetical protein L6R40_006360 [Xanthomendoza cf. fulva]
MSSVQEPPVINPLDNVSRRRRLKASKLNTRDHSTQTKEWNAEVIKVERCTPAEYLINSWSKIFEYTPNQKMKRFHLRGSGDAKGLELILYSPIESDPDARTPVHTFRFPTPDSKISLRLYDATALIEVFTDANKKKGQAAVGDYWAIFLRGHNDQEKVNARRMLRRLEGLARVMPDDWFSYRNFFTTPGLNYDASIPPPIAEGQHSYEMAGGVVLSFTGTLATKEALEFFGHRNFRLKANEARPMTRSMAKAAAGLKGTRKGERMSARLADQEARRKERQERRATLRDSSPQRLEFPPVVLTPPTGYKTTSVRSPSSSLQETRGDNASQADEGQSESDKDYPIKGILDDDVDSDGEPIYLISWEPKDGETYDDTWEPEENVSPEALAVYRQAKVEKAPSKKRKKGSRARPTKRGKN